VDEEGDEGGGGDDENVLFEGVRECGDGRCRAVFCCCCCCCPRKAARKEREGGRRERGGNRSLISRCMNSSVMMGVVVEKSWVGRKVSSLRG